MNVGDEMRLRVPKTMDHPLPTYPTPYRVVRAPGSGWVHLRNLDTEAVNMVRIKDLPSYE